jgi:hypothetical protein
LTIWLANSARVVVGRRLCPSRGQGAPLPDELRYGCADFVGAVLMDEAHSADGGLAEVGPRADEVADAAMDDEPWFGVDEQLGHIASAASPSISGASTPAADALRRSKAQ